MVRNLAAIILNIFNCLTSATIFPVTPAAASLHGLPCHTALSEPMLAVPWGVYSPHPAQALMSVQSWWLLSLLSSMTG